MASTGNAVLLHMVTAMRDKLDEHFHSSALRAPVASERGVHAGVALKSAGVPDGCLTKRGNSHALPIDM
ncbi:hypothetical protein BZL54_07180 [Burkholderia ubonensis subsp. mesacidophila]|uniref:Uncharacterized protein n=1 Tax=Burkholderia ubonensis subsp. mesacidophila TaxID=265293 RepID=A0A2A4FKC1_9BURK|nr:hypothetical protein BZL54_07180 [Burkholderia ubonensis subsp. mesacidophila]